MGNIEEKVSSLSFSNSGNSYWFAENFQQMNSEMKRPKIYVITVKYYAGNSVVFCSTESPAFDRKSKSVKILDLRPIGVNTGPYKTLTHLKIAQKLH